MSLRTYPRRFLIVSATSSALLLLSSVAVAAYLIAEQSRTADELSEALDSRREAINTEEVLTDLIALQQYGDVNIAPLFARVDEHLAGAMRHADLEQERVLTEELTRSVRLYREQWRNSDKGQQAAVDAAGFLLRDTLPACRRLREFNARQIDHSEERHRATLRAMAGGLVAVGGLGSVAGVVLGFGLARGLRRAVDQLLVRVEGATEMLGQELPAVELRRAEHAQDKVDDLVQQVEQAVRVLQRQEREVRRAERLAALGQLAAGVAHEIRNPLTSVQLLVQTARNDPAAGGLTDDDLALIDDELGRIERSLKTYLDYARPPKLERIPCDPSAVVRAALALVRGRAEQQRVEVRFHSPPAPVALDADPELLRQVVLNLLLNALDAMPVGGGLDVAVNPTGDRVSVEVTVADSGAGIAPEMIDRLFEPFATGKETGLGLGLVVSRRIVDDHGGTIRGFNRPDGGACFLVRLPLHSVA
jgi:two-component system sensor histidine kinase HydH